MTANFLILFVLIGLAVLSGWLTRTAWRATNPLVKWIGTILSGLLTLAVAAVSIVGSIGTFRFYNPPYNPVKDIKVEGTPAQVERGEHLAAALCAGCHSTTTEFPMTGGVDKGLDLPVKLGSFYSANLTPAGPLKDWTDGEIFRALRDNVDKDGKRLVSMAGTNVRFISDEDMLALIAFLRSTEPMENEVPEPFDQPNFHALLLTGANRIQDRPLISGPIVAPEKEATAEYGQFLVSFLGCQTCHGEDLKGGTDPLRPKGPTLRIVRAASHDGFILAIRTGFTHTGRPMEPTMPWKSFGKLDDIELGALYQYLLTLE
jgi:mono/diheme cytochrome c family protein